MSISFLAQPFHTTVGHMITMKWSLRNHFHSHKHLEVLSCSVGPLSHFKMIPRKPRSLIETHTKWNGVCCGTFPRRTCRSRLTISAVSTIQNWKRVCVFLCQETVVESYNRSCSFSFLFLQQFNSVLSTNTSTFDTSSTLTPVNNMS